MRQELKAYTINLKSLSQNIESEIVVGEGDANGRIFRIIFDQEAAAQLTPDTKVYLKWYHQQQKIKGYNVFKQVYDDPVIWEIHWPQSMLYKGDVLCCIELVDDISIADSTNFKVHVLQDPNDGSDYVVSDDFSIFQEVVLQLNNLSNKMQEQMDQQQMKFDDWIKQTEDISKVAHAAYDKAVEVENKLNQATFSAEVLMKEF